MEKYKIEYLDHDPVQSQELFLIDHDVYESVQKALATLEKYAKEVSVMKLSQFFTTISPLGKALETGGPMVLEIGTYNVKFTKL